MPDKLRPDGYFANLFRLLSKYNRDTYNMTVNIVIIRTEWYENILLSI